MSKHGSYEPLKKALDNNSQSGTFVLINQLEPKYRKKFAESHSPKVTVGEQPILKLTPTCDLIVGDKGRLNDI